MLGLSRTRMTTIARDLEAAGLIEDAGLEQRAATGRPAEMLRAQAQRFHHLGIHVRAAEVVATAIDLNKTVVWELREEVVELTSAWVLTHLERCIRETSAAGLRIAAVAVCGSTQQIDGATTGVHIHTLLDASTLALAARQTGVPVYAEDDVAALTALEQWPLLHSGQDSMVLISMGYEIAVCVVTDLKIVLGAHQRAGRWAHTLVANDGPPCRLGHHGCLWGMSSVASMSLQTGLHGLRPILEAAGTGHEAARAALRQAAWGLGAASGNLVNLIDPDKVVLTGDSRDVIRDNWDDYMSGYQQVCESETLPEIEVTSFDSLEWARAAAGYALFCTLTAATI
ncbi:ROK family protein [Demequina lutea]|uniref:Putative NBD/HSP70 family sugar kinase n=1 Tax=Demequina lutea TaxID=431489 RepID=A0A7Z0CL04_9MICO|nr:ROK family protein [Demequina lutea]NYI42433.1 putative NBD/HSP70 family sugar kinase [Demequina lutea]